MQKLSLRLSTKWLLGIISVAALALLSACGPNPALLTNSLSNPASSQQSVQHANRVQFDMIPSPGIKACLPYAKGHVTVTPGVGNDELKINVSGLAPNAGFALFVIETPNKPFG